MPVTRIVTGEWAQGREIEVIEAVQSAMLAALKIPDWDRDVTVDTYSETQRIVPIGRSQRFTRVEITMFAGRSIEAKRSLYQTIVQNLAALGVPELEIKIVLNEQPLENWGVRGGLPASEIELSFKVDV
ncbi:Tautomerase enzyme [Tardiphaga sp. OK246]|jgi:phenylpyruvate tautomerase PptA (4-oxalocrotonate tautomerase family)|uniref:tautomerase family protein n=1 Tax=Tardiphaga sp. OK246 TaxID=1855307 RepID=UPI000B72883C|nr:tautomerase family protein [Tardiphaga sp. OK246]SNS97562.1 Tautomerase enzyme [Tardiphaga sp. OK246]